MPYVYTRTIHFADTDAAGVVFFANYLAICHEAYEEAVAAAGLPLREFFAENDLIVPVTGCSASYLRPLRTGDRVRVTVQPESLTAQTFAVVYEIVRLGPPDKVAARVRTEHICITAARRQRRALPPALDLWVRGADGDTPATP